MEMNYTLAWMLQTTRRLTFKGSSAIFVVVQNDIDKSIYISIISTIYTTPPMYPSPCLSSNNNQTKECWYNWVLTGGKLPAPVTDWQSVTRWIKYKDQLLSIFQHSLEEIVHICPVIRHERTGTLFYSSWIFSYILFVSQRAERRQVLIDSSRVVV